MTALIVIAAVILFLALALNVKLRVQIQYLGGELDFKLKYLWFTLYPLKEKKPKKKKKTKKIKHVSTTEESFTETSEEAATKKNEKPAESVDISDNKFEADAESEKTSDEKVHKEKLSDKLDKLTELIEKIKIIWGFAEKRLRKIFTHIYIEKLMVDFIVAGDDACKTAVSYGAVSGVVYNGISLVSALFPTKVKSVDIVCDFDRKKPVYDIAVNVTARPSTLISAALGILVGFAKNYKTIMGKSDKRQTNEAAVQL